MEKLAQHVSIGNFVNNHTPQSAEIGRLVREWDIAPLSADEVRAQRLSFVMGMLPHDCTMTREQVQEILDRDYGYVPQ